MTPARGAGARRGFYVVLGLIVVVGVAALAYAGTHESRPDVRAIDPSLATQAKGYLIGSPTAKVQALEFADFECPACGQFATVTEPDVRKRLIDPGLLSIRYFDFPLPMHRNTWQASHAAACANEQGKFVPMHDSLFATQGDWNGEATGNPKPVFQKVAGELGLDVSRWSQCYDDQKFLKDIEANAAEATRRGIQQTPTFIIGGKVYPGAMTFDQLRAVVDSAAKPATASGPAAPGTASTPAAGSAR